jgi:hypothetical protein
VTTSRKLCRGGHRCTPTSLKEALGCVGCHSARPIRELAECIGVSEGTLGKQLSQYDEDNYLPLRHLVPLTLAAQNFAVFEQQARAVGGIFVPLVGSGDGAQLGHTVREFGELLECHAQVMADGTVSTAEVEAFAREADEAIAAIVALKLRIQQAVPAAPVVLGRAVGASR